MTVDSGARPDTVPEAITQADESFAKELCQAAGVWPGIDGIQSMAAIVAHRRPASQDAGEGLREALTDLVERAAAMPTKTPAPGSCTTEHPFMIEAGVIWALDLSVQRARKTLLTPPSDAGSTTREGGEGNSHRSWRIKYDPTPIPVRDFDWSAMHPDYDGADDANDDRLVFGRTVDDVVKAIDGWYEDNPARLDPGASEALGEMVWTTATRTSSPDASPDSGEAERDALAVARVYAEAGDWNGAYHAMRCAYDLRITASLASFSGGAEALIENAARALYLAYVQHPEARWDAVDPAMQEGVWRAHIRAVQAGTIRVAPSPKAPANRQEPATLPSDDAEQDVERLREAFPETIGRLSLGDHTSDGDCLCGHSHPVPAGHPLYWPEQFGGYPDDIDPLCLAHAIDEAIEDDGWCEKCCPANRQEAGEVAIWSGEHRAYWRRGSRGEGTNYTLNLDEAGIWTRDEAAKLTSHCGPEKLIALHDRPALYASNAAQVSK